MLLVIQLNCDGFWAWPWPLLLAFLLGALLGWLLSKMFGGSNDTLQNKYDGLQAELDACRSNAKIKTSASLAGASSFAANSAKVVVDDSVKDDLTKIEGIGPKIKGLLNDDGIWSWKQLSEVAVSRIQKVLDAAGPRYRVHNPGSWPKQAGMAARGEWDKLNKWQDEHKGGLE